MRYLGQAFAYWPQFLLAALWLVAGIAALYYARSTRRPLFLLSGLAALLLMLERLLSPLRFLLHYLSTHSFYGGGNVAAIRIEFLFGAYKYEWVLDGLAVLALLAGVLLEIRRARQRARRIALPPAGMAASGAPSSAFPPAGNGFAKPQPAQPIANYGVGAPTQATLVPPQPGGFEPQVLPEDERPTLYQRSPAGPNV